MVMKKPDPKYDEGQINKSPAPKFFSASESHSLA